MDIDQILNFLTQRPADPRHFWILINLSRMVLVKLQEKRRPKMSWVWNHASAAHVCLSSSVDSFP
jgi:hypothetical protein